MQLIRSVKKMQNLSLKLKRKGKKIGFVPTMGFLHEGHLSLVERCRKDCDILVVSIFVNPTQFGPREDYKSYPRDLKRDIKLCKKYNVDIIFYPDVKDMYPEGFETYVELEKLPNHLCGLSRPGHFRGVATVVTKLFNIVQPDVAYFGEKDWQQLKIIEKLVRDLNFPIRIKSGKIIRERDGLAMSSRNKYLSEKERKEAICLYKSLLFAKELIEKGERDVSKIKRKMRELILKIAPKAKVDYIEIVDPETLESLSRIKERNLVALAVKIGVARLIDNMLIKVKLTKEI
ncbi:MAG: pantoate--beta-alanine ligase [Caldiserica bacterium]|nr:MAG: pantoate--beta-alanine ligase [Caldisericota bacterium]